VELNTENSHSTVATDSRQDDMSNFWLSSVLSDCEVPCEIIIKFGL